MLVMVVEVKVVVVVGFSIIIVQHLINFWFSIDQKVLIISLDNSSSYEANHQFILMPTFLFLQ